MINVYRRNRSPLMAVGVLHLNDIFNSSIEPFCKKLFNCLWVIHLIVNNYEANDSILFWSVNYYLCANYW